MKIEVKRFVSDDDTTLSLISIDGRFMCFGLEDEYRAEKVAAETRIPAGEYRVTLRDEGGMTQRYRTRFPGIHRGMLWLRDVPNFSWVYFHIGNTDEHTEGCILVGRGAMAKRDDMSIQASADAYRQFYSTVVDAAERGDLIVHITGCDRIQEAA